MLKSIQFLRALAALLVVFFHTQSIIHSKVSQDYSFTNFGAAGVDIFFVISGFIMIYVSYNRFETKNASWQFIKNRILRIVPTYYLFTTFTVLILLFLPTLYSTLRFDLSNVIFSYLFILSENSAGEAGTVVGVGWTLALEAFFYLIFAIMLNFNRKYLIPAFMIIFLIGSIVGPFIPYAWATTFANTMTFEFLFGCLIGMWYIKGRELGKFPSVSLIVLGFLWMYGAAKIDLVKDAFDYSRVVAFGIPAAMIVLGTISLEKYLKIHKSILSVGDSSYSLYLIHQYTLMASSIVVVPILVKIGLPAWIIEILLMVIAVISGFACYYLYERPITRWLKSRSKRVVYNVEVKG